MTVKDLVHACQFGIKIEIQLTEYFPGDYGDRTSIVYEGEVGKMGKCNFYDYEVDLIRIHSKTIIIDIHSFRPYRTEI